MKLNVREFTGSLSNVRGSKCFQTFFKVVWSLHQHRFHEAEVNQGFLLHFLFVLILIVCFLVFVITKPLVHFMRNTSKAALKK